MTGSEFIDLPAGRLHYWDSHGSGAPIVFLHATSGTIEAWTYQLEFFANSGYRAIAFDRLGWGQSTTTEHGTASTSSVAGDLETLMMSLELQRFHVVGIAGGALHAIDYAAWRPERVRTIALAATLGCSGEGEISDFIARIEIAPIRSPEFDVYREVSAGYRGSNPAGAQRWAEIAASSHQPGRSVQALRTPNTYAKLEAISAPVLAIAGGADLISPPALMRKWAQHIPNIEFSVLPEAGHAVAWEEPEIFNSCVLAFLDRHG